MNFSMTIILRDGRHFDASVECGKIVSVQQCLVRGQSVIYSGEDFDLVCDSIKRKVTSLTY